MHKLTDIIKRIQSLDESLARDCAHFDILKGLAYEQINRLHLRQLQRNDECLITRNKRLLAEEARKAIFEFDEMVVGYGE